MNDAVFIITHKRADEQLTLRTLQSLNCSLPIYLIVDDLDPQLSQYKDKYGDMVKVFSKEEVRKSTDTVDNFHILNSALFARVYCQTLAQEMALDHYAVMDDDISSFKARFNEFGLTKTYSIKDITPILQESFRLLDETCLSATGYGNAGAYFGGLTKAYEYNVVQVYIFKTSKAPEFKGTRSEDEIANLLAGIQGTPMISNRHLSFAMPPRGSNAGGLHDDYHLFATMFVVNMYSVIVSPSSRYIVPDGNFRRVPNSYPKILEEKWKRK